jgi:4a-hydroxytetrahydrobiopterin dehydratase
MALLGDEALRQALGGLPGWAAQDGQLEKTYAFPTFPAGIAFVTRVADAAERAGHHPDIDIRYDKVTLRVSTHSEGGITEKDVALAREADALAQP